MCQLPSLNMFCVFGRKLPLIEASARLLLSPERYPRARSAEQIKQLEDYLGVALFVRMPWGFR